MLTVPPLRERKEDIPLLVEHFLAEYHDSSPGPRKEVAPEVLTRFLDHSWPGNVRELKNTINYSAAMSAGERIAMEDLPGTFLDGGLNATPRNIREDMEKHLILRTLQSTNFNRSRVAQLLNMSRKTLYNKMERYGINA